ncbi:hypothetical protein AQI88_20335 [Streptomyces cellostaticus]|uniref:NlpC/P60 domain-containing protein n=1 Tax=Streptomyces cellostaticus TaxID=67285 RepID=A0A101NKD1_9ACTN|nr:peptidoglycan-binding protein [Streptomyces cellostaticus]KUM94547.1 hypothetical protein AQI88_20335 [Streptomyces cellostaticus]GHI07447.1 membrane protein [Streptomyces cellostaticus]
MTTPVFEDVDPVSGCDCPGCVHGRRAGPGPLPARFGVHPAARGVVVVAAASAALGVAPAAAAPASPHSPPGPGNPARDDGPATPQGKEAPLYGLAGKPAAPAAAPVPAATRTDIIIRAKLWVAARVPYNMRRFWSDGYRQDCSGFVSMAWGLPGNEWTGSLGRYGVKITKEDLQPGDVLLFHNANNPAGGSHVVIFGGWTDYTHASYMAYEQTPAHARRQATPYPYWNHADKYVPYRYKGVTAATAGTQPATDSKAPRPAGPPRTPASHGVPGYPGRNLFRPGEENEYVTELGRRLVKKGFGNFYATGPGPRWGEADRRAVEAFQRSQGWRGGAADGYPGPETWRRLFA